MARRRTRRPLNVYLNSKLVGRLRRHASGAVDFQYAPAWLSWDHAIPVSLSLPLRDDRFTGQPVIAVLDNMLPDAERIRRQLAEQVRADGHDAFSLLSKLGRDCVGALQYLPDGVEPGEAGAIEARAIDEAEIERKLEGLWRAPLGVDEDGEFRISIAGAQEKTALLFWKKRWNIPHGTTATTHILKPRIGQLPNGIDLSNSVENEYLCMKLAAAFGLPTAEVAIKDFGAQRVLVVERFDRLWARDGRLLRLPQEDCCQALSVPSAGKYEVHGGPGIAAILELLKGSDEPQADRRAFLKAQVLFWLIAATDGHAKNFSLFLHPGGRYRLTPLYDIMSAQMAFDAGQMRRNQLKLALAVGKNRHSVIHEVLPRHFAQTAAAAGVPAAVVDGIFEELLADEAVAIAQTVAALPEDFPEPLARSVLDGVRARLRTLERQRGSTARPAARR